MTKTTLQPILFANGGCRIGLRSEIQTNTGKHTLDRVEKKRLTMVRQLLSYVHKDMLQVHVFSIHEWGCSFPSSPRKIVCI